jgi:hypothetical protein
MRFDIKLENTIETLENLARECQQGDALLRISVNGNGDYRCFSMPLQQAFCPYQEGIARIEYRDEKLPFPKHMDYYRCEYNGGGLNR